VDFGASVSVARVELGGRRMGKQPVMPYQNFDAALSND
jgi:hypothetical protein